MLEFIAGLIPQFVMDWWMAAPGWFTYLATTLAKILLVTLVVILCVAFSTYFERKVIGSMQARVGPNRVGWKGLLQPFADVFKLLFKEVIVPSQSSRFLYVIAPLLSLTPALAAWAGEPYQGVNNFLLTMRTVMGGPQLALLDDVAAGQCLGRKGSQGREVVCRRLLRTKPDETPPMRTVAAMGMIALRKPASSASRNPTACSMPARSRVCRTASTPDPEPAPEHPPSRTHPAHAGVFRCHRHHNRLYRHGSLLSTTRGQGLHCRPSRGSRTRGISTGSGPMSWPMPRKRAIG